MDQGCGKRMWLRKKEKEIALKDGDFGDTLEENRTRWRSEISRFRSNSAKISKSIAYLTRQLFLYLSVSTLFPR
jgi:hypothetical protein